MCKCLSSFYSSFHHLNSKLSPSHDVPPLVGSNDSLAVLDYDKSILSNQYFASVFKIDDNLLLPVFHLLHLRENL